MSQSNESSQYAEIGITLRGQSTESARINKVLPTGVNRHEADSMLKYGFNYTKPSGILIYV